MAQSAASTSGVWARIDALKHGKICTGLSLPRTPSCSRARTVRLPQRTAERWKPTCASVGAEATSGAAPSTPPPPTNVFQNANDAGESWENDSGTSKASAKEVVGVLLLNLGGPETLNDVRPFLYNLFADPDIIRLPPSLGFLQEPLAFFVSALRAPKSKEAYESIGMRTHIALP
eukprot:scaffold389_cov382-Prasinococcus_capsulatus_cf.AAC.33